MSELAAAIRATAPFPILGPYLRPSDFCRIRLSIYDPIPVTFDLQTMSGLEAWIQHQLESHQARFGVGGYLEPRNLYQAEHYLNQPDAIRNVHLGVDIWGPTYTPIFAPLDGFVHSFANNDQPRDYGATIILEHRLGSWHFYTLYGHLQLLDIQYLQPGQRFRKGQLLAHFGPPKENGGWVPHLHFQVIIDLQKQQGDYPGVCANSQLDFYQTNCPDPTPLLPDYMAINP